MAKKFTTQRGVYKDPATGEQKRIPKLTGDLIRANWHNSEAMYNLGTFALTERKYSLGIELLERSIKLKPTSEAYLNTASCYKFLNNLTKAKEILEMLIKTYPAFPLGYNNLGLIEYDVRNLPRAIALYEQALALKADYGDARWNYALAKNLQYFTNIELGKNPPIEDFHLAMDYFESRFEKTNPVTIAHHDVAIPWKGQPLKEKESIVIACEQGIGDVIQFMRYAYHFNPSQVKLHIPRDLHFMAKPGYICIDNTFGDESTYIIPIMSISKYFPISGKPYMDFPTAICPKEIVQNDKLKIGIVWKGNPDHANDRNRSRMMNDFKWLTEYGDIYSLQKDAKAMGWLKQIKLTNWATTCAAIKYLDIIISVDTSVVHLAGAMGKPVINILPATGIDWRWGEIGENCMWYDSMRFARMQSMKEVKRLLEEFIANGKMWGPRKYGIRIEEFSPSELKQFSHEAELNFA